MTVSRRRFLSSGMLAAVACTASPVVSWADHVPLPHPVPNKNAGNKASSASDWQHHAGALDHITRNDFTRATGSAFAVFSDGATSPIFLRLLSVADLPALSPVNTASMAVSPKSSGTAPATSGFMLFFSGPNTPALAQGTYLFQHSGIGDFALLIVPAGVGEYSAVINRLATTTGKK